MTDSNNYEKVISLEDDEALKNMDVDNETPYISRSEKDINALMNTVVCNEGEAYKLYNDYAIGVGFSIRRGTIRYHVGTRDISQKEYYCSSEDHNHELASPSEIHLLRSNRELTASKASVINSMINAGISTKHAYAYLSKEVGGSECVGFTKRDCYNYVNKQKMVLIEAGDSQSLINHFKHRMSGDAMYVYTVQVDQENRMTNFFWRDGRSRIDYDCFGDVVVFDTTYHTNRYNLICAPFVRVNHHWQNCMFGCAFLLDETTDSFIWLFTSFLESMGGKAPKTIITDQDQAISNAIAKVFPNTRHQLCLWHISKNAPSHLDSYNSNPEFRRLFYKCLQGCETEAEFQATWDRMMDEFSGLRNHKWLNNLYKIREKWCMALNNDVFSGGFKSSQRSESTNNVLNGIANKSISLTKFVLSFEDVVARWRSEEANEDYNCKKGLPSLAIRNSGILNHAAKVYTNKIFKLF
ncbi:hypothetical protein GH714_010909 [Hevea brasiliensis]|uniref:MULE transposase domain-containing protein n=1 Tax=Hevea brasiliensis TaxID=3981 RepID=A0A6A6N2V4_HEVBR|nr:hypothetical protein GH714_010909 [Hevea brasiliensis]